MQKVIAIVMGLFVVLVLSANAEAKTVSSIELMETLAKYGQISEEALGFMKEIDALPKTEFAVTFGANGHSVEEALRNADTKIREIFAKGISDHMGLNRTVDYLIAISNTECSVERSFGLDRNNVIKYEELSEDFAGTAAIIELDPRHPAARTNGKYAVVVNLQPEMHDHLRISYLADY